MNRKALGKGINALIPDFEMDSTSETTASGMVELLINEVSPGDTQPRKDFNDEKLQELEHSIRENGVIQPIVVQKRDEGYEIICGERRWRASKMAGLKKIPAIIREVSSTESLQMALIENIHRQDLNPIEEAEAYKRLSHEFGLTQEVIAKQVGKNRATVANYLRLLKLSKAFRDDLITGQLTMGHARALLALKTDHEMEEARREVLKQNMNVRQVEAYIQKRTQAGGAPKTSQKAQKDIFIKDMEKELERSLGTKVEIVPSKKGGKLIVLYYSNDDLSRIHDMIVR
ncbi:MAG: ParB/RepB/Spo0J family partition protein [Nitrospinota bacterium]|nr:ParB/RepB/Spo0J family partition protein [Nitrospinota bacterium]